ncbi:MAG: 2-hydroxyacyl-CoA dehydratase [Lentisphaeria bacterium]|nr:2-hydroxyacyl-CoA dehydratase [Lentisphaeria bacterium]
MSAYFLGIDIGSTTFKAVLMSEDGEVRHHVYLRTRPAAVEHAVSCTGHCAQCGQCNHGALKKIVLDFLSGCGIERKDIACTVVTGSQIVEDTRKYLPFDFKVSEVSAHVAGALHFYPDCKAILDVGGQDSKAMIYNDSMHMWNSKMSGICAAGTGAFLDSVALKLNIPVEDMEKLVDYSTELEFSSVCAVLSATSINKFKNRYPIGQIIGAACRAQARTIISGVGELLFHYKGDIVFQGGVASNSAVAHYLGEITGNRILIPKYHRVMGALGAACLARQYASLRGSLSSRQVDYVTDIPLKSIQMRANSTRREFFSKNGSQLLVGRNLFYPTEILNALGVRIMTLETYAALFARNPKRIKKALDMAAYKGFTAETCSFLRVLEGSKLPTPDFCVSTSQPCQQGERVFADLARQAGVSDRFYSLNTPISMSDSNSVETIAEGLEKSVSLMEKAMGIKMDPGKLAEACNLSNEAAEITQKCNELRWDSPPLIRGTEAVYNAVMFSQLWGKKELIDIQAQFLRELQDRKRIMDTRCALEDTHRILWLHLPPFYDTKILDFVEDACCVPIVFEEVNFVDWEKLDPDDPYRSLARKLLTTGYLDPKLRVSYIVKTALRAKLTGCILYNHGFGRCSLSDSCFAKLLREELRKINVPLLTLDGDCMDQTIDPCSTFTKISAFTEALNSRKYGNIFGPVH